MSYRSAYRITTSRSADNRILLAVQKRFAGRDFGRKDVDEFMANIFLIAADCVDEHSPEEDPIGVIALLQRILQAMLMAVSETCSWLSTP